MHRPSEGMRRLGIVFGVVGALAWIIYVAVVSEGFSQIQPRGWVIFLVGVPFFFVLCFVVIWMVDWVIAGFRMGSER